MDPLNIPLPSASSRSESNGHGSRASSKPSRGTRQRPTGELLDRGELDRRAAAKRAARRTRPGKHNPTFFPTEYVRPGQPLTFDRISSAGSPSPHPRSHYRDGRSGSRTPHEPSKSITTSSQVSSKASYLHSSSSSAEHADKSRAGLAAGSGGLYSTGKFQAEPSPKLPLTALSERTVCPIDATTYQGREDQATHHAHPKPTRRLDEGSGDARPRQLDHVASGSSGFLEDRREKIRGPARHSQGSSKQVHRRRLQSEVELLPLGPRHDGESQGSGRTPPHQYDLSSKSQE